MKKLITIFICLVIGLVQTMLVFGEANTIIPDGVQKIAQDGFKTVKAKISTNPLDWGFSKDIEIDKLVLGQGQLVHFLGTENIEKTSNSSLSQLEDNSIDPVWLYTLDLDGTARIFLEVSTNDKGMSYYLLGYGGFAGLYQKTQNQFHQMLLEKGLDSNSVLYSISGRYIFASLNGETEWALPVPINAEIENADIWKASQLWTSIEILKVISDAKNNYQEGSYGSFINFSQKPEKNTPSNKNLFIRIIILSILLFAFSIIIIRWKIKNRISMKLKFHAT